MNENEDTKHRNLYDSVKEVLTGKFIAVNICIKKVSQINNLYNHLKTLVEEQN